MYKRTAPWCSNNIGCLRIAAIAIRFQYTSGPVIITKTNLVDAFSHTEVGNSIFNIHYEFNGIGDRSSNVVVCVWHPD